MLYWNEIINDLAKIPYFPVDNARVIYTSKGQNS
jgi:hypothetical protein